MIYERTDLGLVLIYMHYYTCDFLNIQSIGGVPYLFMSLARGTGLKIYMV